MEIGLYTFAEVALDLETGSPLGSGQRFQDLLEEMALADQVGLDVFGVGEHHRPDFAVSSPAVALAAGAALTERMPHERRDHPEFGRPGASVSGLRHTRPRFRGARRDHGESRVGHRVLPALRVLIGRLRRTVFREAGASTLLEGE